eukprot:g7979.t1
MAFRLSLLLVVAATTAVAHDFQVCSGTIDHFGTSAITLVPDPPLPGANFTTSTTGTPDQLITGGSCTAVVKALGITVKTETYDLCSIHNCPMQKGVPATSNISSALSAATPHGVNAKNRVTCSDTNGVVLSCVEMVITIG